MDEPAEPSFRGDPPRAIAIDALLDRRELALIAFERTRMPMVVTDPRLPDHPIVLANQAFLDLTGYSAEEVVGHNCRFLQGPGTLPSAIRHMRDGLTGDHDVSVELLNYRKDGSAFWNQLAISPVTDKEGNLLYYFGSQKDVSERRRAQDLETAERLLLLEVDHRAMNALALVQSIVRLSASGDAQRYAAAVQGRVDALARAHRLLALNRWSATEFRDVLDLAIEPHRARVALDGPSMPLSAQIVQPVALVVHELLSNAVSHGALSREEGTLAVRWRSEPDRAVMNWREHGPVPPPVDVKRGFGLSMIEGVIERQLGGTTSFNWTGGGLEADLRFPTAGLVSA